MTPAPRARRLGSDTELKCRLAGVSPRAATLLGEFLAKPCSDQRVVRALRAATSDAACPESARTEFTHVLSNLNLLEEKRVPRYSLKLTDDEHERIEERAAASGRSVAAYVRAAALGEL